MKHFIRLAFAMVLLLTVLMVFKEEIASFSEETYYSLKEDETMQFNDRNYLDDFRNDKYWDGDTFLLDDYLKELGFIPALRKQEGTSVVWRCGARRFSVDESGNAMIGIVGDSWDDLTAQNEYVEDGYCIKYDGHVVKNVSEETVLIVISSALNLRKNDNLRSVTDGVRCDIDEYHDEQWAL